MTAPAALQRVAAALRAQLYPARAEALAAAEILDALSRAPRTHKERRAASYEWICKIAERFYAGNKRWTAACGIAKGLASYRSRAWQRVECDFHENPNPTEIAGYYWEILKLIDEPIGERQIDRILKKDSGF